MVSPLRSGAAGPAAISVSVPAAVAAAGIRPPEPYPADDEPADLAQALVERDDEPPLSEEAQNRLALRARQSTSPLEAGEGQELHLRFKPRVGFDRAVAAMEAFRALLRQRPGSTPVFVHLTPEALPMRLRGVAYDADLVAEVQRRLGDDLVDLSLA